VRDYAPPLVEDAQVQVGWPQILARAVQCRFNNCLHLREPGCAVTDAVEANELSARRYESYKRLLNIMRGIAPRAAAKGEYICSAPTSELYLTNTVAGGGGARRATLNDFTSDVVARRRPASGAASRVRVPSF